MKVQSPTVSADLVFDEDKGGNRCVAAEAEGGCKGADKDDKNACCKETSGQFCHEGAKTKGFFLVYDEKKKDNQCVLVAKCVGTNQDDTNACCKAHAVPVPAPPVSAE